MTIASALTGLNQDIVAARTAITNKGGTVTSGGGSYQLASDIGTIPTGGGSPVITSLTVAPTTSAQTIAAPSGTDGYSPVYVNAVTAAIDSNIKAGNIKSGVSILGVTGNVVELNGETRSVSITSTAGNTFTPSSGKNAITSITVTPNNQARTVNPSTSSQSLTVNSGYSGNGTISVSAVTASIDSNIQAENIKKDVQILGVTGTYEGSGGSATKYGASLNTLLGDINASGVLQYPSEQSQLVFTGVTDLPEYILAFKFYNSQVKTVSFPELTDIKQYGMYYCFGECTGITSVSFPKLTTITGNYGMNYCFNNCTGITSVSFSKLTSIAAYGMYYCFARCTGITSVSFSKLTSIAAYGMSYCFTECTGITSVSFPELTTITGNYGMARCFNNCTGITSVSFPKLTTITGNYGMNYCFTNCTGITSVSFSKLTTIGGVCFTGAFAGCSKIANIYFNKVTTSTFSSVKTQFNSMFNSSTASTSGTVNVHFPSNLSSTISGLTGYPAFGGNSSRVVLKFDLAATS